MIRNHVIQFSQEIGPVCLAAMLAVFSACAGTREETFTAPRVDTVINYYTGTYYSEEAKEQSGRPESPDWSVLEPGDCLAVHIDVLYIDLFPDALLEPLTSSAELILRYPTDHLIRAVPLLFKGARWGELLAADEFLAELERGDYGRSIPLQKTTAVLPPGATVVFGIRDVFADAHPIDGTAFHRSVEILTQRGSAADVRCILAMENFQPVRVHEVSGYEPGRRTLQSPVIRIPVKERVTLPVETCDQGRAWAAMMASPFAGTGNSAIATVIRIETIASGGEAPTEITAALKDCIEGLGQGKTVDYMGTVKYASNVALETASVHSGSPRGGSQAISQSELETVLGYVDLPVQRRSAMIYILRSLNTRIALDLVLTAPDEVATELSQALIDERRESAEPVAADIGWTVERAACRYLTQASTRTECPPEFIALLALHTGALCRDPWTMEDILDSAENIESFRRMIVDENVIMLEDRSPANRTRAFLFLQGRGVDLGDYDPLAPRRERQAALMKIVAGEGGGP